MVTLVQTSTASELLGLIGSDGVDEFINNSIILLSMVAACGKATIILKERQQIIQLIETLKHFPCQPQDLNENAIQTKFQRIIT